MVTDTRAKLFQGLADSTRWQIVQLLSSGGLSVSELASRFPMSRPAVSKHLRVLRLAGLVVERKEGRRRIYEVVAEPLEKIAIWMERLAAGTGTQRGRQISATLSEATDWFDVGMGEAPKPEAGPQAEPATGEEAGERDEWRSW